MLRQTIQSRAIGWHSRLYSHCQQLKVEYKTTQALKDRVPNTVPKMTTWILLLDRKYRTAEGSYLIKVWMSSFQVGISWWSIQAKMFPYHVRSIVIIWHNICKVGLYLKLLLKKCLRWELKPISAMKPRLVKDSQTFFSWEAQWRALYLQWPWWTHSLWVCRQWWKEKKTLCEQLLCKSMLHQDSKNSTMNKLF